MDTTYEFLELLELDEGAEERDIRRAYARKLKRIDQAADPDGFQALRNAYEVALVWARWKLTQEAEDAPPPPAEMATPVQKEASPPEETQPPEALRLGSDVFDRLGNSARELQEADKLGDVAAWRAAIEARFADEELVNIDARIYFEAFVASMLANGWRPGHEALFVAATDAFGWDGDRRRLWQLGQAGHFIDQALEERRVLDALPEQETMRMRDLAKMLRSEGLPARREILKAMRDAERMLVRFPALMAVVTNIENIERWRTIYREAGGKQIDLTDEETPPPVLETNSRGSWYGWPIAVALFFSLRLLFNSFGSETEPPPAARFQRMGEFAIPFVDASVLDKVAPPARYTPTDKVVVPLNVVYKVYLDANRKVRLVENRRLSGDAALDQAARDALMAAPALPLGTPNIFLARYVVVNGLDGWLDLPPGKPIITDRLIQSHLGPVMFKPDADIPQGDYRVECALAIDSAGVVDSARIVKSSGIPRLDNAVLDMVRKSHPFPPGTPSFTFTHQLTIGARPIKPATTQD